MKMHRPILLAAEAALVGIFIEGRHAEKVVDYYLKNEKKWGARDRRQFAEVVYDIVRWWRTDLVLAGFDFNKTQVDSRVVSKIIDDYLNKENQPKENYAQERAQAKERLSRAERESIPDWLDQWGELQLGEQWGETLQALNKPARQYLRANALKCDTQLLRKKLIIEQIETDFVPGVPSALVLKERKNVFKTEAYKQGLFEMQDGGSQLIAPFLQATPGDRVVDACAGAGGKTLHLASEMKNKGQIIALDLHDWKLNELKTRARRAGVNIVETRVIENSKVIKRLHDSADRLLLDVPCSGLGVLRRHPDTKWKLSLDEINKLQVVQQEILEKYSPIVKLGGALVYATCSIAPAENETQIHKFLANQEGKFKLEEELKVSPAISDFDGFYAARLTRLK